MTFAAQMYRMLQVLVTPVRLLGRALLLAKAFLIAVVNLCF